MGEQQKCVAAADGRLQPQTHIQVVHSRWPSTADFDTQSNTISYHYQVICSNFCDEKMYVYTHTHK